MIGWESCVERERGREKTNLLDVDSNRQCWEKRLIEHRWSVPPSSRVILIHRHHCQVRDIVEIGRANRTSCIKAEVVVEILSSGVPTKWSECLRNTRKRVPGVVERIDLGSEVTRLRKVWPRRSHRESLSRVTWPSCKNSSRKPTRTPSYVSKPPPQKLDQLELLISREKRKKEKKKKRKKKNLRSPQDTCSCPDGNKCTSTYDLKRLIDPIHQCCWLRGKFFYIHKYVHTYIFLMLFFVSLLRRDKMYLRLYNVSSCKLLL